MAVLHDRLIKADFWVDGELLRWPAYKRWTYEGLWHIAEASGCLEDDPFDWKLTLWPSPKDYRIKAKHLLEWRDELVAEKKLIPYEAKGKHYLYIVKFHDHQTLKNPGRPDYPLPPWLTFEPFESNKSQGRYRVDEEQVEILLGRGCEQLSLNVSLPREEKGREEEIELSEGTASPASRETIKQVPHTPDNLIAVWAVKMKEHKRVISSVERGKMGKYAKEVIDQGARWNDCVAAVGLMAERGLGAHLLGSLINQVSARPGGTKMDDAHIKWLRGLYRKYGDEARKEASSEEEWQEVIAGVES
jgi:hypothetical protein